MKKRKEQPFGDSGALAVTTMSDYKTLFETVFYSAPDTYFICDLSGTFIDGNRASEVLTGYRTTELIGKNFLQITLLARDSILKASKILALSAIGRSTGPEEFNITRKNGASVVTEVTTHPVKIRGKLFVLGIARDVSERKRSEEERDRLLQSLEEVNRKKTEFVSDVSHELRTPLASIKGFVSTIRSDKEMDEKTRGDFMKIIEEETDRLTRIIEDLLDLSRIEAGRMKVSIRRLDLAELLAKDIESVSGLAGNKGVTIEKSIPSDLPQVYTDADKATQIIVNLLSNAIKYNRKGGKISVTASTDDSAVNVSISDTGMGISEKDLPHIFEKFFRAERTSSESSGTGLGLAVTKSLVELLRGEITVDSKQDRGSTFRFTLPTKEKN